MIRVSRPCAQAGRGRAAGFGGTHDGTEIAGILNPLHEEVDAVLSDRELSDGQAGDVSHRHDASWRVAIRDLRQ